MAAVPIDLSHVTWAVLAGGKGTRMGQPKAMLQIDNQPIVRWLIQRMNWPGPTLLVTAPGAEHPPGADAFDLEAVDAEAVGPLGGVRTALEAADGELVVITTVDAPGWADGQLRFLVGQIAERPRAIGLMLRRMHDGQLGIEPFPCAIRRAALPVIVDRLATARRSTLSLGRSGAFDVIDAPLDWPAGVWTNLNTPDELAAFIASLPK